MELTLAKIARKILLYVGLAIAALVVFAQLALVSIRTGIMIPGRWFGLAFWTPFLFWWVLKPLKRYWKRRSFWLAVSSLLMLHFLGFSAALLRYPAWPLIWFAPCSIVEAGVFTVVLIKLFDEPREEK